LIVKERPCGEARGDNVDFGMLMRSFVSEVRKELRQGA